MKAVCDMVASGKLLKDACEKQGVHPITVRGWALADEELGKLYTHARIEQAHAFAEQAIAIADDGTNDTYTDEDGKEQVNHDVIQRSRLRVDTRKWMASKLAPKLYGEKLEVSGDKEHPIAVTVQEWTFGNKKVAF